MPIALDTPAMEALSVEALPRGKTWRYEPKWDGFRCLAFCRPEGVELRSKSGKSLNRYFPDIVALLERLDAGRAVLDGELVVPGGSGYLFGDLQARLHPAASRVAKLAAAQPARYILFDLLQDAAGHDLTTLPLTDRRAALTTLVRSYGRQDHLVLSPQTASLKTAQGWLTAQRGKVDGLMAKDSTAPYAPGERAMQKYKPVRTADCVVGGFRYNAGSRTVGSLLLGLYDANGLLNHVGFTSSFSAADKTALAEILAPHRGPPGFTGNAPGGLSRWSTERSAAWETLDGRLVAEVSYDHVSDDRFRHGTRFLRWRPDKAPRQCTMEQILQPAPHPSA